MVSRVGGAWLLAVDLELVVNALVEHVQVVSARPLVGDRSLSSAGQDASRSDFAPVVAEAWLDFAPDLHS